MVNISQDISISLYQKETKRYEEDSMHKLKGVKFLFTLTIPFRWYEIMHLPKTIQ